MSRLADLIAQLCPDGVECRALGEMGSLFGGLSGSSELSVGDRVLVGGCG